MTVTFCGHREIHNHEAVASWVNNVLIDLAERGADTFLLGNSGSFDRLAASLVNKLKRQNKCIRSILVLPYISHNFDSTQYDESIYPPLEQIPKRFSIIHRNYWMVDNSDIVVSYVLHDWGGAAKTLGYAVRKKKTIIQYGRSDA